MSGTPRLTPERTALTDGVLAGGGGDCGPEQHSLSALCALGPGPRLAGNQQSLLLSSRSDGGADRPCNSGYMLCYDWGGRGWGSRRRVGRTSEMSPQFLGGAV